MAESYDIHLTDPLSAAFQVRAFTSNGTIFPTSSNLNSTAVGAETSLLVYGKGHPNYGERIAENIIHILENFSGSTEPLNPVSGQLWFDRITAVQINGTPQFRIYEDGVGWGTAFTPDLTGDLGAASDGDYYWNGSALFLAVKDTSHPLAPTWLQRTFEDLSATGVVPATPRKVLKVYDGEGWRDVQKVYSTVTNAAPTNADNGDLWYNTTTNQLMIYDGGWTSVAANYLPLTGGTLTGDLDMGSNYITNLLDPVNPQDAATRSWVLTITGAAPTALPDLSDVDALTVPTNNHFLKGNGSSWSNAALALSDFGVSASATELNYSIGVTSAIQTQLNGKVDIAGDTMTGDLNMGSNRIEGLTMSGTSDGAATRQFVIDQVSGASFALEDLSDVVYQGGSPAIIPVNGQVLQFNGTNWENSDYAHMHVTSDITHTSTVDYVRDVAGTLSDVPLDSLLESALTDFSTQLNRLNSFARREVFTAAGSPASSTDFVFTDGVYYAGTNRLSVYVNGVKQYANERARQSIQFDISKNLSRTSLLGLPAHPAGSPGLQNKYYLDVAIDGGTPISIEFTLDDTSTIGDIINGITGGLFQGSPLAPVGNAMWDKVDKSIHIFSKSTGNGSSVEITEPASDGLLTALTNVALGSPPDTSLPVLTYLGGSPDGTVIYPAFGTNVTQVTTDLGYAEVDDSFEDILFGVTSSSIRLNAGLTAGAVVEMISESIADAVN